MNWKLKAMIQQVLSNIPFGTDINYLGQRYVTKSLPIPYTTFVDYISVAKRHLEALQKYSNMRLEDAKLYEFGAGWNLVIPLAFWAFSVDNQFLIDIRKLLRVEMINDTIEKFQRIELGLPRKPEHKTDTSSLTFQLKEWYGIDYRAPLDVRHTRLESESIDFITSTNTFEHIPLNEIPAILKECRRILRKDGLMSFLIDYQDHHSYLDRNISVYNFYRYSDKIWTFFNPAIFSQNRLRHPDYLGLLQEAGFSIVEEQREDGTTADLDAIKRLPLDRRFRSYSQTDLAIRTSFFVLRKAEPHQRLDTSV